MVVELIRSVSFVTVGGMVILAAVMGAVVGVLHRTYIRARVPFYVPIIVGLGGIGLWLNGSAALIAFISNMTGEAAEPVVIDRIETNTLSAILGACAAYGGGRAGDVLAPNINALVGAKTVDREVSKLVRTVGRVITVTIPEKIDDIDGYEPVSKETKSKLAGIELVFPRGLTVDELRDRIATRLREDHGVGHVDVEVTVAGEIEHFAMGSRAAGIGPTLPPRRVALGLKTNPAPKASPGDRVHIWEPPSNSDPAETTTPGGASAVQPDPGAAPPGTESNVPDRSAPDDLPETLLANPERWYRPDSERFSFAVRTPEGGRRYRETAEDAATLIEGYYSDTVREPGPADATNSRHQELTASSTDEGSTEPRQIAIGELRATSGDVATVSIDIGRLHHLDQSKEYRLVTLQADRSPDREFAALLRTANETMDTAKIVDGSELDGLPVGSLSPTIVAIRPIDGPIETIPSRERLLRRGDIVYAIGRPDELRKLHTLAAPHSQSGS